VTGTANVYDTKSFSKGFLRGGATAANQVEFAYNEEKWEGDLLVFLSNLGFYIGKILLLLVICELSFKTREE
jgi:hypothetical protein